MTKLQTFQVFPAIPAQLSFLETLSRNLWWSWRMDAIELFRRINPRLWEKSGRNPIVFLTYVSQERFEELSKDEGFLAHLDSVRAFFQKEILSPAGNGTSYGGKDTIGYFSMEFGIHESVPLFAGGLGVLAGDHLKAASDLHLPVVGVGILYRHGYFHQYLGPDGWQQEEYPETELYHLPVERAKDLAGNKLRITIPGPGGNIVAKVWKIHVGRIPLFLMDTYLPENTPEIREISSRLYVATSSVRVGQEILLGIGGMRALAAMGIFPTVCHMNEGHCAFAGIERITQIMDTYHVDLKTAMEIVPRTTIFTTHTPVAAGYDEFPLEHVAPYLQPYSERLGIGLEQIFSWGQSPGSGPHGPVSMFILGLRMSQYCNGVSELHGRTARRMWSYVWPGKPEDEIPISHITNGIHISSWISTENALLFDRYLGPEWSLNLMNSDIAQRIDDIYDEDLWRAREMSRSRLIRTCRSLTVKQFARRNAPKSLMEEAESVLDPDVLTIGFARRFAAYKRANLLLRDPERLEALITSKNQPIQLIFAGKAHPKDNEGKDLIQRVVQFAQRPSVRHRIVFLEDYDINIARYIIHGADIWLNTPRRPLEACGTSGMKAAINGTLNVSTLDGWWHEGYSEDCGWRIGGGEEYADWSYQDLVESQALYNVLENEVIPCFYDRRNGDSPSRWIRMMKASMKKAMLLFSAQHMVSSYDKTYYHKAASNFHRLLDQDAAEARRLTDQKERYLAHWKDIRIEVPAQKENGPFRVGDSFLVNAVVHLGELKPEEVKTELYFGHLKSLDSLIGSNAMEMTVQEPLDTGAYRYGCLVSCQVSGRYGFTVRVTPRGDDHLCATPGLITWAL